MSSSRRALGAAEHRARCRRSRERSSTISPPTCESGSGHSQRSSGSRPSATADPSALAWTLPKLSSTGRGAAVVPLVCTTSAVSPSSGATGSAAPRARQRAVDDEVGRGQQRRLLGLPQPRVDRHRGGARQQARVQRDRELQPGRERERDAAAGRDVDPRRREQLPRT